MQDILFVSGTRPEIIKLAPLYHALRKAGWANVHWLHTGQHAEMATSILACFDVTPDTTLSRTGSNLLEFSTGCRHQLELELAKKTFSLVVVQGDTESAFQGALAAFYNRIPVAHVEAGLRTYNLQRPFPEEGLRQMISKLASFHFAPTERARTALQKEGISDASIHMTGNTVIDAQQWTRAHRGLKRSVNGLGHLLVTVHRRENWGNDLTEICYAIATIAAMLPEMQVLFPVHLNPVVKGPVHSILKGIVNVKLTEPLDYTQMQQALADSWLVLTDSGGLQEEAPTFGVPVLVLRDETERPEAIEAGCAMLIGASRHAIVSHVVNLAKDEPTYRRMALALNPFGDGTACQQIVDVLAASFAVKRPALAELV